MPIPEQFIDELVARSEISDVVSSYVHLTRKGNNLWGLCPFHNEKTPSFSVSPDKQIYHCFGCGKGGGVISFIMEIENLPFPDAVRLLAQNSAAAAQDWTESSVLRRFNALATADSMPEVSHYLRGMVQLFRGNEPKLKLDYPRLAVELYRFQLPDQAANVRLQWGRDLYQMNADTPETEEKEN